MAYTVARYLNVSTWSELLELTGLSKRTEEKVSHLTVEHISPAYEKISRLLENRKE